MLRADEICFLNHGLPRRQCSKSLHCFRFSQLTASLDKTFLEPRRRIQRIHCDNYVLPFQKFSCTHMKAALVKCTHPYPLYLSLRPSFWSSGGGGQVPGICDSMTNKECLLRFGTGRLSTIVCHLSVPLPLVAIVLRSSSGCGSDSSKSGCGNHSSSSGDD